MSTFPTLQAWLIVTPRRTGESGNPLCSRTFQTEAEATREAVHDTEHDGRTRYIVETVSKVHATCRPTFVSTINERTGLLVDETEKA